MKHLYYVRHGLSEANKQGIWSGIINPPLSLEGHEQAKAAGKVARQKGLVFDVIVSSPFDRAHHTAKHIAKATRYPHDKIILHDLFRERAFGELEGKSTDDIFASYRLDESSIDVYKDVERLIDLQWRAQQALDYLHSLPHDTVLVVAHGAFGRALRRAITNEPINVRMQPIPNAEIIKFI